MRKSAYGWTMALLAVTAGCQGPINYRGQVGPEVRPETATVWAGDQKPYDEGMDVMLGPFLEAHPPGPAGR